MLGSAPLGDLPLGDDLAPPAAAALTASISESATATESESSILSTSGTDSEAAIAGDAASSTASLLASDTETATASDSEAAIAALLASDAEAAAATEAESGTLALGATQSESVIAGDSETGALSMQVSDAEAASAADSSSASLTQSASDSESATAAESGASTASLLATEAEAASATESESAISALRAADSEAATAGDLEAGVLSASVSDSEAATASSAQSATVTLHASELEAAIAGDSEDSVLTAIPHYDNDYLPDFVGQAYRRFRVFKTMKSSPKSAGDQALPMSGSNILWAFDIGWNELTRAQAQAVMRSFEFMGGADGQYFFEWHLSAGVNVGLVGTPLGGVTQALILPALMYGGTAAGGGLTVAKNGVALSTSLWSYSESSYFHARDGIVTLAPGGNTAGAVYTASWTSGRRRRRVRLYNDAYKLAQRPGLLGHWSGQASLVETEAGL